MIKTIISIIVSAFILFAIPTVSKAEIAMEYIDNDFNTITVTTTGNNLRVAGANGQTMYIYNVTGVCVSVFKVDGADKRYELNLPKGCYIVKIGKFVRKISIS